MVLGNCRSRIHIFQCSQAPKNFNLVTTMSMPPFQTRHMQLARNDVFDKTGHEEMVPELEEIVHGYHWERLSAMDHEPSWVVALYARLQGYSSS